MFSSVRVRGEAPYGHRRGNRQTDRRGSLARRYDRILGRRRHRRQPDVPPFLLRLQARTHPLLPAASAGERHPGNAVRTVAVHLSRPTRNRRAHARRDQGGTKFAFVTETGARTHYTSKSFSAVVGRRIRERVTIVDTATGDHRTIALPQGEAPEDLAFAADGRHLIYTTETPTSHGLRILATATGTVHQVELGDAGAELGNVAIDSDSAHLVVLVFLKGESRLVWYSLDTLKITRKVALGRYHFPETPSSMGPFVSGDTVVVMVGDTVYRATGAGLRRQHADPRTNHLGREGTW